LGALVVEIDALDRLSHVLDAQEALLLATGHECLDVLQLEHLLQQHPLSCLSARLPGPVALLLAARSTNNCSECTALLSAVKYFPAAISASRPGRRSAPDHRRSGAVLRTSIADVRGRSAQSYPTGRPSSHPRLKPALSRYGSSVKLRPYPPRLACATIRWTRPPAVRPRRVPGPSAIARRRSVTVSLARRR